MKIESPSKEVLSALGDYLQRVTKSPKFKAPIIGWPTNSAALVMPAMSLLVRGSPILTQYAPHLLSTSNIQTGAKPISDNIYDCGEWEFSIQLDLWLKTDAERYDAQTAIINAFYQFEERVSNSIRLPLKDYFESTAVYSFRNSSIPDAGSTPLTQEFRVLVDIFATCSHLVRRENESLITSVDLVTEVEET